MGANIKIKKGKLEESSGESGVKAEPKIPMIAKGSVINASINEKTLLVW